MARPPPLPCARLAALALALVLNLGAIWIIPPGQPPVSERTMAQISYRNPRTRTYSEHPQPTGPLLLTTAMNPGAAAEFDALFTDGSTAVADEAYLREKILEPMKRRVTTGMVEMPSYRGVLTDAQIESLVLYIKTLSSRGEDAGRPAGGE